MKNEFPKGFFQKIRKEATSENNEFDEKTCVAISKDNIKFVDEESEKIWDEFVNNSETNFDNWIVFSENKPKKCGRYLLTVIEDEKREISVDDWVKLKSGKYRWDYYDNDEVIAWKNVPEVYKG